MAKKTTKAGAPNEAAIRDYLAEHLDLIEPGLSLEGIEVKLPSRDGASGFLDIFARDAKGRLVIIEIKRTRGAARESLQELFKYAALIREKHLVQGRDYRLILLSVDWEDLLVPYSEFAPHAPFAVNAGQILLGADAMPTSIASVMPSANAAPRKIAVRHFLWGFVDRASAEKGVGRLAKYLRARGLTDFVLVQSRPTPDVYAGQVFLYFAQQELALEEYIALLRAHCSAEALADFMETIEDLSEPEDKIAEAADAVWSWPEGAPGRHEIGSEQLEIAHPEKGRHWFNDIDQADIHVHRFGRFEDPWISDETIITEIVGEGGESDFRLRYVANTGQRSEIDALVRKLENIFFFNPDWQGAAIQLVRYAERKPGSASVEVAAFSNEDVLRGVAGMAFGYPLYCPTFRLSITHAGVTESFFGLLEWDGTALNFDKIIADHFGGDTFAYFLSVNFGENRSLNRDILADMGLRYSVFREAGGQGERVRVQGSSIVVDKRPIIGSIPTLIDQNMDETGKLVAMFMEIDQGFAQSIAAFVENEPATAEAELEQIIRTAPWTGQEQYWHGDLEGCDLCSRPFAPLRYMVDACLQQGGANLCAPCFLRQGGRLGLGRGQAYEASALGWRRVAG